MSIEQRLAYLVGQVAQQAATTEELQELSELINADQTGHTAREVELLLQKDLPAATPDYNETYWDQVASRILAADHPQQMPVGKIVPMRSRRPWMAAAIAVGLLLLASGVYWQLRKQPAAPTVAVTQTPAPANDVAPGGNKAVLVLADGTEVPLDSTGSGTLAQQGDTRITKPAAGQLLYSQAGNTTGNIRYNTLRTPRGGQFQVTLPDGTRVWLNAASTLRYPTAFNGRTRLVQLKGEAYFEVAANAAKPFKVNVLTSQSDSMEVAVLGTHFNIMAYDDEALVKTTLLEGAVQVSSGNSHKRLSSGQGASLNKQDYTLALHDNVNTEEAVAWKNGFIQLEGNDIQSAMRLIARWYDVEVVYKAPVPAHFRGIIPRNVPVSQVLKMMELTGEVHFEIKGKQLIVSP
ncbi:FecR family protein [Chitinophaga agrisoli]|uniref:FecR family protein n=1 Tax=Chitinophaga agrisoli TaxID=2607653 RepID=A0A5B2W426_9BACT|nr:FecR domain-containing protein [Chitinophaga agrisoli]KAA2245460.1 FecR family protein [Chitinophaga agrisoli]